MPGRSADLNRCPGVPAAALPPDEVGEDYEVGGEDLVHLPYGLDHRDVVLACLRFDVSLSLASHRDAGCTHSPRSASTRVTGSWVSQSISRSGCRARSSSAISRSRRTWPRPIGEQT
jgi:hypothetical protein